MKCNTNVLKFTAWIFFLITVSIFFLNIPKAFAFHEGWESSPTGTYSPDMPLPLISADEGDWLLGDTVSEFPECGATPHTAEILSSGGNRSLRLTSSDSSSSCADNIWVNLFEVPTLELNLGFSVPLTSGTIISFEETGNLINPETGSPNCVFPPCGDTISVTLEDNRGNMLAYVLQRAPGAVPNEVHSYYREVFLDPNADVYSQNLFTDFNTIPDFNPSGATIRTVAFEVSDHGIATIDNICIGTSGCIPLDCTNDLDNDEICDEVDNCLEVANTNQVDSDEDGMGDACDTCPNDATNDADSDEVCDDIDNCLGLANTDQADADSDAIGDVCDDCPSDPDNVCNVDQCPDDPNKTIPGVCGCGVSDIDSDEDGTLDCNDVCPEDSDKIESGVCGCGVSDDDSDEDGTADCNDECPDDPDKIEAGDNGCGVGGDGCFIATAAYGSYWEPHVMTLRQFRDSHLLTNKLGTKFVEAYYKYSPPMADYIAEHDGLRSMVRIGIAPLVGFSWLAMNYGMMIAFAFLFSMLTMIVGGICFIIKTKETNQ